MKLARILCATDFSEGASTTLGTATRLSVESGAELVLFHAWYVPATAYSLEATMPLDISEQVVADARRGLDDAVETARRAGATHVQNKLVGGVPWTEIVTELEHERYDLCVIGTHGRTGLSRILLGSVAEKVVRHAPCPVLVVRPENPPTPFSHVLIPTDFSESAARALDLASRLVQPDGVATLLHVIELPVAFAGEVTTSFTRDLDKRSAMALEHAVGTLRAKTRATVKTRSSIGAPGAQTLAELEADPTIDLVVMGSHGRTGIKRALMGSVAEKVVRHARCPVLVARMRR
jgi:nucleotide-binding universal stress UspA family protein